MFRDAENADAQTLLVSLSAEACDAACSATRDGAASANCFVTSILRCSELDCKRSRLRCNEEEAKGRCRGP
ncbi:hypothetical protein HaLaN_04522 [Haematococcus lacustris]|uniref:Uncharacterized protein n=1 Tax=Haematococcus lacustris TaxID=44745 RepID=A0A699YR55_HAELA|nr:hypothetical protein HaLaN_04522 [Haematococcus lacustris]